MYVGFHVALQYDRLKNTSRKSESRHIENLYHKKIPNHSEIPLHTLQDGYYQKTKTKGKIWGNSNCC